MSWTFIGLSLLHFLWQGVLIASLAAFACWTLNRASARARYAVYFFALIGMAMCPPVTAYILAQTPDRIAWPPSAGVQPADLRVVVMFWLIGVGLLSFRLVGGMWGMARLGRTGLIKPSEALQRRFDSLVKTFCIPITPRLYFSQKVLVPTAIGMFRGTVLLPASAVSGMSVPMLEALISHELAHVARFDVLVNGIQSVIEVLLFYHPCVWWVSNRIREERENCCDDAVLRRLHDPQNYVRALAMTAQAAAMPLVARADGGNLLFRIRRILKKDQPKPSVSPLWAGAFLTVFLLSPIAGQASLPRGSLGNSYMESFLRVLPEEFDPAQEWKEIRPHSPGQPLVADLDQRGGQENVVEAARAVEAISASDLPPNARIVNAAP